MTNDQDDRTPKVFFGALLLVSLTIQLLSGRALGAKYWWDTIAYFQLAEALRSFDSLRELYSGPFGTVYQHLMPGLPALILLFEKLFDSHLWLAFAISQNVLSAVACVYMATCFSTKRQSSGRHPNTLKRKSHRFYCCPIWCSAAANYCSGSCWTRSIPTLKKMFARWPAALCKRSLAIRMNGSARFI